MKNRRQRPGAGSSSFSDWGKQRHEAPGEGPRDERQHTEQRELPRGGRGERSRDGTQDAGPRHARPQGGRARHHAPHSVGAGLRRKLARDLPPRENDAYDGSHGSASRNSGRHEGASADSRSHEYDHARHDNGDLIFGVEPVRELIAATPAAVRTLYLRAGTEARFRPEANAVRAAGGKIISAAEEEFRRMAGSETRHQGIVAIIREYQYAGLEEVLAARPDPLLLVDGVTDPRNLGALLRSAEGAGVRAVVLARDHTAGLTPVAIKASAGAWIHLAIARCGNVAQTLESLKQAGYWIAALAPKGGVGLYDLDITRRLVVIAGSEGHGVRELVKKRADFVVHIPMRGRVDSLNVAVATAVVLFEIARRRAG
ncbi:MAG: 23S rRNA (guanosine(2251)-2'-O)-methyltransferase RlmB [Candidatus Binataceae bacterium]